MDTPNWPPDHHIHDYHGPYPIRDLVMARRILIRNLTEGSSFGLERLKPKLGINSRFGRALPPPRSLVGMRDHKPQTQNGSRSLYMYHPTGRSVASEEGDDKMAPGLAADGRVREQKPASDVGNPTQSKPRSVPDAFPQATATVKSRSKSQSAFNIVITTELATVPSQTRPLMAGTSSTGDNLSTTSSSHSGINQSQESTRPTTSKRTSDGPDSLDQKKFKFTSSAAAGSSSGPKTALQTYKCDYCAFLAPDFVGMKTHLAEAIHPSGSLYSTSRKDGISSLIAVKQMLAVEDPQSKKTSVLIVSCPSCREVFENIFECGLHHRYLHGSGSRYYSICEVIGQKHAQFPTAPNCLSCGIKFFNFRDLHQHWDSRPVHNPYLNCVDDPLLEVFLCPYCNKLFKACDHNEFESHILAHSQKQDQTDRSTSVAVKIKQIKKCSGTETVPPFSREEGDCGVKNEIAVLTNLNKHLRKHPKFGNFNITNACKSIEVRLKELISTLGDTRIPRLLDLDL